MQLLARPCSYRAWCEELMGPSWAMGERVTDRPDLPVCETFVQYFPEELKTGCPSTWKGEHRCLRESFHIGPHVCGCL